MGGAEDFREIRWYPVLEGAEDFREIMWYSVLEGAEDFREIRWYGKPSYDYMTRVGLLEGVNSLSYFPSGRLFFATVSSIDYHSLSVFQTANRNVIK